MALPDYFLRSAVAAAQVLSGYDEEAIRERLEGTRVGISADADAAASAEGRALMDLAVRLLSRLYPRIAVDAGSDTGEYLELARAINSRVEVVEGELDYVIAIGQKPSLVAKRYIYAGSDGWDGTVSAVTPTQVGTTGNPIGPGIAACLAAANLFRLVFIANEEERLDQSATISGLELGPSASTENLPLNNAALEEDAVLVGVGAIGGAAVWALGRSPLRGRLHLVDPQTIELSNVQRYVLAGPSDEGKSKLDVASRFFTSALVPISHQQSWQEFASVTGSTWSRVLVALDSSGDRRAVQASLPRWIANSWTQPGDLGVSVHPWDETGACLACLYLPEGELPSQDKLIAAALGLPRPDVEARVRQILGGNEPTPRDLLEEAALALKIPIALLLPFEGRPLRELYVEGICGGAVLPLDRSGVADQDVHVPLAHQSALAGVLLASRLLAAAIGRESEATAVTRVDVLKPLAAYLTQPLQKDARGICICQDPVYRDAYELKYKKTTRIHSTS